MKRPKVSNITKVVFVISPKMPSVNLVLLDKKLVLAEYLGLEIAIVLNKTDLSEKETDKVFEIYTRAGYNVIKTRANEGIGLGELKNELKNNISVLAR